MPPRPKQIVAIHGIGDHEPDFHEEWESVLRNSLSGSFEVKPLHWRDLQDQIADKYPVVSPQLAGVLAKVGVGAGQDFLESDARDVIQKYVMDVFAYSFLHNMRYFIQTSVLAKLKELTDGREEDTIILAHSLGCAVSTHVTQLEKRVTGRIPYRGLVLLAPPLGIRSPVELIPDPLAVTPDSNVPTNLAGGRDLDRALAGGDPSWAETFPEGFRKPSEEERHEILKQVCFNWRIVAPDALHFCVNKNDLVCSDVRFELGDRERDLISIKQGYDAEEKRLIDALCSFHEFEFGQPKLGDVGDNHDVLGYLRQPAVVEAVGALLGVEA